MFVSMYFIVTFRIKNHVTFFAVDFSYVKFFLGYIHCFVLNYNLYKYPVKNQFFNYGLITDNEFFDEYYIPSRIGL